MAIQLPPDIDQRVKACMTGGAYQNEEEVLRDAMDALERQQQEKLRTWHERNEIAIQQSRQGLSKPLDDEAVLARLRQRLEAEGIVG